MSRSMISSRGEAEALARTRTGPWSQRDFQLAMFVWGIVVGLASRFFIAPKLLLIYHYGWAGVRRGGLSVVDVQYLGGHRRIMSNGDRIRVWEHELDLFTFASWAAICAVTVPLLWVLWLLLTKRPAGEGRGRERIRVAANRPGHNQPLEWTGPAKRSLSFESVVGAGPAIQRRSVIQLILASEHAQKRQHAKPTAGCATARRWFIPSERLRSLRTRCRRAEPLERHANGWPLHGAGFGGRSL